MNSLCTRGNVALTPRHLAVTEDDLQAWLHALEDCSKPATQASDLHSSRNCKSHSSRNGPHLDGAAQARELSTGRGECSTHESNAQPHPAGDSAVKLQSSSGFSCAASPFGSVHLESPQGIQTSIDPSTVILPSGVWLPDFQNLQVDTAAAGRPKQAKQQGESPTGVIEAPEGVWLPELQEVSDSKIEDGFGRGGVRQWKVGDRPPTPPPVGTLEYTQLSSNAEREVCVLGGLDEVIVTDISDVAGPGTENVTFYTRGVEASSAPAIRAIGGAGVGGDNAGLVTMPDVNGELSNISHRPAMMLRQQLNSRTYTQDVEQGWASSTLKGTAAGGEAHSAAFFHAADRDFYLSGMQAGTAFWGENQATGFLNGEGALPPRPDTVDFKPIQSAARRPPRDLSNRNNNASLCNSRHGRHSPSPSLRSASPTRSWNGSVISGTSNHSTRSDMLRFQTYDGRPRRPRGTGSGTRDFGSLLANPVQPYTPGAALKGSTAVSPLTTPRQEDDSFHSNDFQDWMGAQRSQPGSPKLGAMSYVPVSSPAPGALSLTPRSVFGGEHQQEGSPSTFNPDSGWAVANATPSKPSQAAKSAAAEPQPVSWLAAARQEFEDQSKQPVFAEVDTYPHSHNSPYGVWEGGSHKMGWASYQSARRFGPRPPPQHDRGASPVSQNRNAGRERHW